MRVNGAACADAEQCPQLNSKVGSVGSGTRDERGSETNLYSAAPSALGYLAQVEYALLLVLKRLDVEFEFDISIETLDDVVFHDGDDAVELLQSKHRVDRTAS